MSHSLYESLVYGWIAIALVIFVVLLFITAPYGRHTSMNWGPLIDNKLGWVLMEAVVLIVLWYFALTGSNEQSVVNMLILCMFSFHYFNRSFIFPFRLNTRGKKMPLVIVVMGIVFNIVSGFTFGYYFGTLRVYDIGWIGTPVFLFGTSIFLTGIVVNWRADAKLINLRKPGETGYKIPQGGLFKYISCPNLFGETLEWAGFAVLTWSLPGLAFFVWTFANLVPRAVSHHKWYLKKFPEYPPERKAVIPFVW